MSDTTKKTVDPITKALAVLADAAPGGLKSSKARRVIARQVEAMRALLRDLEWAGGDVAGNKICPSCSADRYDRARGGLDAPPLHASGCRLAALIGAPCATPPPIADVAPTPERA